MPFRLGRRRNDSGSTGSFSTATPPGTPRDKVAFDLKDDSNPNDITAEPEEIEKDDHEQVTPTATASSTSFSDLPTTLKPDWADDIPPDTTDDSSQSRTRRKLMLRDEEPNIQTDREAKITDGQFQKWYENGELNVFGYIVIINSGRNNISFVITFYRGSGGLDLWWARDFGRWRNHDLCVIVTVNHGLVKRKGFTMEDLEGLDILKKAWRKAIGSRE
ncbi:4468_t:CDS:2 [Paraglomus brasilianum]|uniref:4468_t:CDS:1 n=1 Tax=Paraglomus brasilianum TaxID=144538 RepID=A0A9N9AIW3_9GLOM|nr:4468_t:CDS:2 [Paraglomus brasilianum]